MSGTAPDPVYVVDRLRTKTVEAPHLVKGLEHKCWVWTGAGNGCGYGKPKIAGRKVLAHRAAYEALRAPIPAGLELDHRCRRTDCWNPWHLDPVTHRINILRSTAPQAFNIRKTHCPGNHSYSGGNLYVRPNGHRECRTCIREQRKRGTT